MLHGIGVDVLAVDAAFARRAVLAVHTITTVLAGQSIFRRRDLSDCGNDERLDDFRICIFPVLTIGAVNSVAPRITLLTL